MRLVGDDLGWRTEHIICFSSCVGFWVWIGLIALHDRRKFVKCNCNPLIPKLLRLHELLKCIKGVSLSDALRGFGIYYTCMNYLRAAMHLFPTDVYAARLIRPDTLFCKSFWRL